MSTIMEQRACIPVGPPIAKPLPSYWHEPKSPLANLIEPEADKSAQPYEYAIIGSGISGTMVAYNLIKHRPNARVIMLEAREICSGATGRNGGHTKAASYRSYSQHKQELGKEEALKIARLEYVNIVETHRMAKEMKLECESELCNTVDVIYDQGTFELGKVAIAAIQADATEEEQQGGGMACYKVHEANEKLQQSFHISSANTNPALEKEEVAGVFEYLAGRIHAYRFTTGVLGECINEGLIVCTNTPVHNISPSSTLKNSGSPSWDISTQFNTITTKNVILATNGYTPFLWKALQGAIVPMRGQITAQRPGKSNKLPCPLPTTYSFIYRYGYEYMIPRPLLAGGQHIIIGGGLGRLPIGGASEFGTVDDGSLNPEISEYLHGSLKGYFGTEVWGEEDKQEQSQRIAQEWTGIMGATADGRPFVGEIPGQQGMWISAGFNGHGMVLCLKAAEGLVDMIQGGGSDKAPEWFPRSFLITEERLAKARFRGRTDLQTPA